MHRLSNFAVQIDADEAASRTYVDAVVMGPRGFGVVNTFGWYDDQLRRTPHGWRIAFRKTQIHGTRFPGPLALIPPTLPLPPVSAAEGFIVQASLLARRPSARG